ncbi:hypothetical protein EN948_29690, partial [Mesorhizobium sp. M7A.F.Ca.US.003.02.1.1]
NEQDQAIIRSAIADSSASTLAFLSSMGQREAIAFGEGVATTMRLKFEKLPSHLLPGTAKREEATSKPGDDVDLVAIVERLRNVPKSTQQAMAFAEVVDSGRQAGDPDYRKPPAARPPSDDDFDMRYGLKPATFGLRPQTIELATRLFCRPIEKPR